VNNTSPKEGGGGKAMQAAEMAVDAMEMCAASVVTAEEERCVLGETSFTC
jgi:hypothetical protein